MDDDSRAPIPRGVASDGYFNAQWTGTRLIAQAVVAREQLAAAYGRDVEVIEQRLAESCDTVDAAPPGPPGLWMKLLSLLLFFEGRRTKPMGIPTPS